VEAHRNPPDDNEPRWFSSDDGERARYAPAPPGQTYEPERGYDRPPYDERDRDGGGQGYGTYRQPDGGYGDDPAGGYGGDPLTGPLGPIGPRSGEPLPPLPGEDQSHRPSEATDVTRLRRPASPVPVGAPGAAPRPDATGAPTPGGAPPSGGYGPVGGFGTASRFGSSSAAGPGRTPGPGLAAGPVDDTDTAAGPAITGSIPAAKPYGTSVYRSRRPALAALLIVLALVFEVPAFRVLAFSAFATEVRVPGILAGIFLIAGLPMFALGLYGLLNGAAAAPGQGLRIWGRTPLVYLPVALVLFICAALAAA
jgi:hypothetical protein